MRSAWEPVAGPSFALSFAVPVALSFAVPVALPVALPFALSVAGGRDDA